MAYANHHNYAFGWFIIDICAGFDNGAFHLYNFLRSHHVYSRYIRLLSR